MFGAHRWLSVVIALVMSVALSSAGVGHMSGPSPQIDCKYENPELHIYMDQIESCLP